MGNPFQFQRSDCLHWLAEDTCETTDVKILQPRNRKIHQTKTLIYKILQSKGWTSTHDNGMNDTAISSTSSGNNLDHSDHIRGAIWPPTARVRNSPIAMTLLAFICKVFKRRLHAEHAEFGEGGGY